jgi:4a-hydroxytetrahydrobiopterin dehydratase
MTDLTQQHCAPCEGGVKPFDDTEAKRHLKELAEGWEIVDGGKTIRKTFSFKGFNKTMGFVNAAAWIANQEGHHPDIKLGFNYCEMNWQTHAIDGLSINDFICAAKVDALLK